MSSNKITNSFFGQRSFKKIITVLSLLLLGVNGVNGQTNGIYESYAILNINSAGNTYYDLNASTANIDFSGANLGVFLTGTNTLVMTGGENKTYKCNGGNITGGNIYYRVYLTSGSAPSFTSLSMSFVSNDAGGCGGNQTWRINNNTTNIISGLSPGAYTIEVYSDAPGTPSTTYASNGGANYKASFTVVNQLYSKSSGNLETLSNWGTNTDGTGTAPSNFTTSGVTYNIRNNATPTIGANWTVSGSGSKIIVGDGTNACNFTVPSTLTYSSTATDISSSATLRNQNTAVTSLGTCLVAGTYEHNANGGTIPTATWQTNSTCNVTGSTGSTDLLGLGQTFFNFTYNCSGGLELINTGAFAVTNTFSMPSTNAGTIRMGNASTSYSISVKDFSLVGGTFNLAGPLSSGGAIQTMAITGAFSMTGGTIDLSASSTGAGTLTVAGNFTHSGGTIQKTNGTGSITLNGTSGSQTLESTGQTNSAGSAIAFSVAGSNAQCVVSASKTFTLSSGSKLTIGAGTSNPDFSISGSFLNQSTTSLSVTSATIGVQSGGNYICNHGTSASIASPLGVTTFNLGSTMTYRGSSSLTPNLSLAGRTYHHLTIESTSGTLSLTGTGGTSLLINGDLTIGANCTFGPNITGTPGHCIKGNITIGSGGTLNYNPLSAGTINLNGSTTQTISGAGTFTTGANATLAVDASSTIDFGATNAIAGSGTFTTASGSTLITANTLGINGSLTLTNKSLNAGSNYTYNGTSAQVTGAALTAANNLTLNNSNGLTLSANTSVTGTLTLTSGKLTTNGLTLTLSNSVSGGSSSNYIVADATGTAIFNGITSARLLPIGTGTYYAPLTVSAGSSTNYSTYVTGTFPCTATDATKIVNLAWSLNGSNAPSSVIFQWPAASQAASFNPATSCDLGQYITTCPYSITNLGAPSGSNPYTLTATSGLATGNQIYVLGNLGAVYLASPTITTTVTPASITHNAASSGGQNISGSSITSKGVVWNTSTAPTVSLSTLTNDGAGSTDFSSSMTLLAPETLFYIRAYATNTSGTGYGDEKTFRTLSAPATVQASSLSATASSASNIDLSWTGATFPSSGATTKGYVLLRSTSPNTPTLGNSNGASPSAGSNTTIVSSTIASNASSISNSGLSPSTQYNYLLVPFTWDGSNTSTYNYLTTSAQTANGTTQAGSTAPVLVTNTSTSITDVTATFNGDIASDGGSTITERGFVYSSSDATPTIGEAGVTQQTVFGTTGVFSYNASNLSAYTVYYIQAYATNISGTTYGGISQFTTLKSEPIAQATSLVFSSITSSSFNTSFTAAVGSPDGYIVLSSSSSSLSSNPIDGTTYSTGNGLGGGTVISVGSTLSGIANTSLSSGTTYYIFVYSYNNSGSNINYLNTLPLSSNTITLTNSPATPTFSSINTTSFTVDWTATSGASSYRLDLSTASNFSSFISGYQDLTVNSTSHAVSGLTPNTLYYARIRAVNASGTSANSSSGNSPTISNPPTIGSATGITLSDLSGNWTAPASQGSVTTTYSIELSLLSNDFSSPVITAASISSSLSTYQFTGLSDGTTYYYRVKAVNSAGSSAWSSVSAGATTLSGSISLTALGTASTQDFNTLASTGTSSSLPSGWYFSESGSSANLTYTASTGSSTGGDTYSFGITSDRAFGSLQSGSVIPIIGAKFKNNTGSAINNLFISYTGETWRVGTSSRIDQLDFQYSIDATSLTSGNWIDANILDYANLAQATGSASLQHSSYISDVITGLSIANGASFMIRWLDVNASGADDGMGVDDFSIKPCGTTSAPTTANQNFCSSSSPTVANLTATGTSIQWYAATSGGSVLATNTALANSTAYYASQTVGGCESVTRASSTITLSSNNTASAASSSPTLCINTALTNITHTTTGASGIGTATGLPAGVTASWASNTITISGTPSASGTFSYSIPLTGGCGSVNATGTIIVNALPTVTATASQSICPGSSVTLSGGGASTYTWNNGVTNGVAFTPSTTTTYTVTGTDANGCANTASSTVSIYALPTWGNLQWPPSGTICAGGTFDIYGQVYENGVTNASYTAPGAGVVAQFGYSASNSNPNTWTTWSNATYNSGVGNNDEFKGTLSGLSAGTYYYAFRYALNNGTCYVYGAYSGSGGGFWDGSNNVSGVLTVTSPTANAGADITGVSTCGKNTVTVNATALNNNESGAWTVITLGTGATLPGSFSAVTTPTDDFTGSYGGTYTLAWTVTNTATNCTNTDNMVVTFNQPITTSLGSSIGNADFLWNGLTSVDWSTGGNWFRNVSGEYQLQTGTIEPTNTNQVFTLTSAQGGVCIGSNMPTIGNGDNALDVFVGSGITLNLASGSLNLSGNLVNNGTINAAQGTINFIGSTNATISGSGTTTLNNVTINKSSSATLTLSTNVAVIGILNMTQGNVVTAASPNGLLTLGTSSVDHGTLSWTSGNIVGPFRRFFTTAATQGNEGLFPVGTATYQRYAKVNFAASPGSNQTLTAWYKTNAITLYNGLPLTTQDGQLIQNYSAEGYWQIDPTDNNYTAPINSANYSIDLYANNLTGMQDPTICRIIKAAGSNTSSSNHVQWQGCGTHTTIPTVTSASAFVINSTSVGGFSWFGVGTSNNQALPVELTSFSGNCADGKVDLEWSTATEHNSAYFQVEYSRDGSVWQNIGIVAAAGNSVQNINYTLTHEQVASGNNYYRLRQVDIDGVEELYDAIAVTCTAGSDQYIMTYPNPSEQNFQVEVLDENLIGTATLSMVDARGMLIHSELLEVKAGTNLFLFNNTGLAPGIYYVKISKGAYSSELVKQVVR
jgi:hypothetical protein